MKKSNILIAVFSVLAVASVARAEVSVDFDRGTIQGMDFLHVINSPDGCSNNDLSARNSISAPVPVLSEEFRPASLRLLRLNRENRQFVAKILPDEIADGAVKKLFQDEKVVVMFNDNEVIFAESSGKEIYNVVFQSANNSLVKLLAEIEDGLGQGQQNKNWIKVCYEVVKWAMFIKDSVETWQWVTETVCEQTWVSGNGEGGHIPPFSEGHVRTGNGFGGK